MRLRSARAWALGVALEASAAVRPAAAVDASDAPGKATLSLQAIERDLPKIDAAAARARRTRVTPAERIASGDMLLKPKDYDRAIDEFSKVVELYRQGKMPDTANADGLFLLSEGYFQTKQFLSARRHYRELIEKASQ